jgi:hypothetical protein
MKLRTAIAAAIAAAGLALLAPPDTSAKVYSICDPFKARLCVGLVSVYEFEEDAGQNRESEVPGARPFTEPGGFTVARDGTNKKLGSYALLLASGDRVELNPSAGLSGEYTASLWVRNTSAPASGKVWPIVSVLKTDSNAGIGYPYLALTNTAGTVNFTYTVKQTFTDTVTTHTNTAAISTNSWYNVQWGQYPNPDIPNGKPYQWTLWSSVNAAAVQTTNVDHRPRTDLGIFELGNNSGPGLAAQFVSSTAQLDQYAVWSGTFSPELISALYAAGAGKAYPYVQ